MELKLYVSKEVTLISQRSVCNLQTAGPVKTATFSSSCCFVVFTCKVSGNFVLALRIFFQHIETAVFSSKCCCRFVSPVFLQHSGTAERGGLTLFVASEMLAEVYSDASV